MNPEPDTIKDEEPEPVYLDSDRNAPVYVYTLEEWLRRSGMRVH